MLVSRGIESDYLYKQAINQSSREQQSNKRVYLCGCVLSAVEVELNILPNGQTNGRSTPSRAGGASSIQVCRLRLTCSTLKAAAAPPGIHRLHVRVRVAALELIETAAPPRIHLLPVPGWSARAGQARRGAQLPGSSSSMSGTERSSW